MTKKSAVLSVVRDVRRAVAPADPASGRAAVTGSSAKVTLLPGRFRGAEYVKRHVAFVVGLDAERGEQHVQRNLDAIRRRLAEIGVDRDDADREVRTIEAAVRREIWQQVLLP
ncbi:DUF6074 family protein [Bradyrhizobium sp. SSUT77]|uniref:DUF6074 family protein n=1 Tax=Bradyrhizobium sp. SSUT77 TaxID=3040603 RepID=UPI002446EA42|nr:DUF6074 family protein [Bradyrhizobium sp. SSUT77]MDH2341500.1 DUF6074 family protein [Bradyrhizobium sp. SSUT77]